MDREPILLFLLQPERFLSRDPLAAAAALGTAAGGRAAQAEGQSLYSAKVWSQISVQLKLMGKTLMMVPAAAAEQGGL